MSEKSLKPSLGVHPFIMDPDKWVGTPWSEDKRNDTRPELSDEETNVRLIAELHSRLAQGSNVADLFSDEKRVSSLAASGRQPVFPGAKKKLSVSLKPTAVDTGAPTDADDLNPFVTELIARRLPLQVVDKGRLTDSQIERLKAKQTTVPVVWTLPHGFSVKNLDGAYYLPLFCHGLRDTGEDIGFPIGDVAYEALKAILSIHGPAGRVFRHLKSTILPLRQGLVFASKQGDAPTGCDLDSCLVVGTRLLKALQLLLRCDDTAASAIVRGSVAAQMFAGTSNTVFALIATPLAALRNRVLSSKEYQRKTPKFVAVGELLFATLSLIEQRGGAPAKRAITSAFPSGIAS